MYSQRTKLTIAAFSIALCAIIAALVLVTKPTNAPGPSTAGTFAPIPLTAETNESEELLVHEAQTDPPTQSDPKASASNAVIQTVAPTKAPTTAQTAVKASESTGAKPQKNSANEIRAIWISFYELMLPDGMTQTAFTQKYAKLFDQIKAFGLNTIFVHVRPMADAIYPSELFPWSEILTGKQGKDPGYDPLGILCALAKERGLALHAWLNPFRAARTADITRLSAKSPTLKHLNANDGWVKQAKGQFFWNPAVLETHTLVYDGVRELLRNYHLAGIHIDDYFYPTTEASFDATQYEDYRGSGGTLDLAGWRRELINQFVQGLYNAIKEINPNAVVSVSPAADIDKNFTTQYADALLWMKEPGFCDWIIPQLYFGFEHKTLPFERTAQAWAKAARDESVTLLLGLAAYKAGQEDEYAGGGKLEWTEHNDILARQLKYARKLNGYGGFAVFSSSGLFAKGLSEIAKLERENLQKLLK